MRNRSTLRLAYGGLLAAAIALLTAYVRLPVVMLKGYAHLGDLGILLSGLVLGPFAALPAAVGSGLADLLAGYPVYAPFTLVIKGAMGFALGRWIRVRRFSVRNLLVLVGTAAFMVGAYFLTDALLYGTEAAVASLVGNCVQGGAMVAGGLVLIPMCCSLPKEICGRIRK
jgi:uncharacterized membrane protein